MSFICITGYEETENCEHCGKRLIHGIVTTTHGVIGADCFVEIIKVDRKIFRNSGKPSASYVRELAVKKTKCSPKRLDDLGLGDHHFRFELA